MIQIFWVVGFNHFFAISSSQERIRLISECIDHQQFAKNIVLLNLLEFLQPDVNLKNDGLASSEGLRSTLGSFQKIQAYHLVPWCLRILSRATVQVINQPSDDLSHPPLREVQFIGHTFSRRLKARYPQPYYLTPTTIRRIKLNLPPSCQTVETTSVT